MACPKKATLSVVVSDHCLELNVLAANGISTAGSFNTLDALLLIFLTSVSSSVYDLSEYFCNTATAKAYWPSLAKLLIFSISSEGTTWRTLFLVAFAVIIACDGFNDCSIAFSTIELNPFLTKVNPTFEALILVSATDDTKLFKVFVLLI